MQRVAIVPYVRKSGVVDITCRLVKWLSERDIGVAIPEIEAVELGYPEYAVAERDLFSGADLVVSLGGDGTTLRAVRLMGERTLPVMGVNLGELGFLMWVKPDRLEDALESVKSGRFRIEERHMLKARIRLADGGVIERSALNDVLIGREEFSRLVKLDVFINGVYFCRYSADGLVVSTPTGSTAYSFSAGGPFISPSAEVYSMVPICPHSLNNRSLVFSSGEKLIVRPVLTEPMATAGVSVDGVGISDLGVVSEVGIELAEYRFKFVSLNGPDFYQALGQKLQRWLGLA